MRQITAQEKYRAVKEGILTEGEFVRQMRLAFPQFLSPMSTYPDTVQILKNYDLINEGKEAKQAEELGKYSDDSLRRSIDIELEAMGLMSQETISGEDHAKAKIKAIKNLKKDPLHYYNLIAGESSKVDKNDKPKETKRGALEKDTFNDLKKADLKEEVIAEGTRALVGYLAGDRLTTAYNHYDGYPSHLGKALEMHYNNDEAAKDLALKGYISSMDADTGEIKSTHKDPPGKIKLSDDEEQMAREIGEEIDSMGADYGYIWDDRSNRWITIKNTGIRSMIDQVIAKMGDYGEMEEEVVEIDSTLDPYEDKKIIIQQVIDLLKTEKGADNEVIKDFIKTHYEDIINLRDDQAILDEFEEFLSVNTDYVDETDAYDNDEETQDMIDKMRKDGKDADDFVDEKKVQELKDVEDGRDIGGKIIEFADGGNVDINIDYQRGKTKDFKDVPVEKAIDIVNQYIDQNDLTQASTDETNRILQVDDGDTAIDITKAGLSEKKGKDLDGDGDIDGDDYKHAKDKAIKKAMGKDEVVKENLKAIITKVLEEDQINEAATNVLAAFGDDYAGFDGMKSAINALENIVTDIEQYYDKTRTKIQKVYDTLGEIRNEEGLKVGGFLAPAVEQAFNRDLRPVIKQGFTKALDMPQVKKLAKPGMAQETEAPKQTVFGLNEKKK